MTAPLFPERRAAAHSWRYLAFQTVFLGELLYWALRYIAGPPEPVVLNGIYFLINFLAVLVIFRKFWMPSLMDALSKLPRILLCALAGFAVCRIATVLMGLLLQVIDPQFLNYNDQSISAMSGQSLPIIAIGTVFLVPVTEELLHRGAIFGSIYPKNRMLAYAVSAGVFALVHVVDYMGAVPMGTLALSFLQYIPAGLVLAASYRLSGSIWAPILIHGAINLMSLLSMR